MMQCNVWRVRDETSVVGLGLEGLRDGSGTEGRHWEMGMISHLEIHLRNHINT